MDRLPTLAFGNESAECVSGADAASEAMSCIVPTLTFSSSRAAPQFLTKYSIARIGDIGLVASSVLPCQMEVSGSNGWHLVVPSFGTADLRFERNTVQLSGSLNALLLPNVPRITENFCRSAVIASLDIRRLHLTMASISGQDENSFQVDDQPQEVDMRNQRDLFPSFQRICGLIDSVSGSSRLAEHLGIDDLFYRWAALAISGVATRDDATGRATSDANRLDEVCDLMRSSGDRLLNLTEMEIAAGMSARALQYAFKHRFGCSPMEWQRQQRIQSARERLISSAPGETITQIAYAMGFSSSAAFSAQYKRYFGETPTQTLLQQKSTRDA